MKKIQLLITFILNLISLTVIAACPFKPEQVGANYLERKGPKNEDYEVYLVGTTLHGGNDRRFFENPVYAVLSKSDCRVIKEIRLPAGGASQKMILNKQAGNIVIIMFWYNDSNKIVNSVAVHDYETLEPISHKQIPEKNISPDSTTLIAAEGKNMYSLFGGREIYKLDIDNLVMSGKYSVDESFYDENKLGTMHGISLTQGVKARMEKKGLWNDFEEQPLIAVTGRDKNGKPRRIDFSLTGEAIRAVWFENGKPFTDSPAVYEKKFNIKIQPLPFIALTPNSQGKELPPLESVKPKSQPDAQTEKTQRIDQSIKINEKSTITPTVIPDSNKQKRGCSKLCVS